MNILIVTLIASLLLAYAGMRMWNTRGNAQDAIGAIGIIAVGLLGICATGIAFAVGMMLP